MMVRRQLLTLFFAAVACLATTQPFAASPPPLDDPSAAQFNDYWYPNGAEVSRFELEQARYGEVHGGDAILVFVTESMNPILKVKSDIPKTDDVPVLKLNASRKFFTGIYPYAVMTSVFSAIDVRRHPLPLKISFSAQEWCGHVYSQLNLEDAKYVVQSHSYFEQEADQAYILEGVTTEDAVWNTIRIAPSQLPLGRLRMIPGLLYSRLMHRPLTPLSVTASLMSTEDKSVEGAPLLKYSLEFPGEDRILNIYFEVDFPHRIQGWDDSHRSLPHMGSVKLTTRARRTHTLMIDYWNRHSTSDRRLLEKLGLSVP